MKKSRLLLLFIAVCLLLSACGENKDNEVRKSKKEKNIISEITNVSIKETKLYDEKDITITAKEIKTRKNGIELKIAVENKSKKDIIVSSEQVIINDLVIEGFFYTKLNAGKSSINTLNVYKEALNQSNIKKIGKIEVNFEIVEDNIYNKIASTKIVEIKTNNSDYQQKNDIKGKIVVDKKELKITYIKFEKESKNNNSSILLFVENNSKKDLTFTINNLYINNAVISSMAYDRIPSGKKGYTTINVKKEDLEENEIKEIKNIEFDYDIYESLSLKNYLETKVKIDEVK